MRVASVLGVVLFQLAQCARCVAAIDCSHDGVVRCGDSVVATVADPSNAATIIRLDLPESHRGAITLSTCDETTTLPMLHLSLYDTCPEVRLRVAKEKLMNFYIYGRRRLNRSCCRAREDFYTGRIHTSNFTLPLPGP